MADMRDRTRAGDRLRPTREDRDRLRETPEPVPAASTTPAATTPGPAPVSRDRRGVDWSAAFWAGLIAGLVFLVLELLMVPLFLGGSAWGPPRMIAAIVLGEGVLPPPATFDIGIVMVAMVVHFALSALFGVICGAVVNHMRLGTALAVGAVFGLVLYLVNFYLFTGIFPWFAEARNWVSVFTHIVFGVVAAWAYLRLVRRRVAT